MDRLDSEKAEKMALGHPPLKGGLFFTTLVIDGKRSFAAVLVEFLEAEGHSILLAETAQEALAMTHEFQPELILLGVEQEGSTGLALLRDLLFEQPSAAVILLASHPSISESVQAIRLGAVDYLERPLDLEKLKQAIRVQKALLKTL